MLYNLKKCLSFDEVIMSKMLIKEGDFEGESWRLQGEFLTNGFYKVKELPLAELRALNKRQQLNDLLYVKFEFTNGITFIASMNSILFDELYDVFQRCKNNTDIESATESTNLDSDGEPIELEVWRSGQVPAKHSQQNILMLIGGSIFSLVFIYGVNTVDINHVETLAYQKECIESIHTKTGYNKEKLIGDGREINYQDTTGDIFTFRCDAGNVRFFADSTGNWMNM